MTAKVETTGRILLITLSNIGDLVMTTPVLETLHARHPQSLIDILADRRSSELLKYCPYRGDLFHRDKQEGWRGTCKLVRRLRQRRYDLVVDLRTDGLAWLLRSDHRLTRFGQRLSHGHSTQRHMAVLRLPHTGSDILPVRVWLSDAQPAFAETALSVLPGRKWLAIGPGANWEPKRWPAEHFHALLRQLDSDIDAIVCLGSAADRHICERLVTGQSTTCLNLAGRTDLLQAAAVLRHMALFIGNDSGLGHIAAAMKTPTLTLFGPGDPGRYHPWGPNSRWLQSKSGNIGDLSPEEVASQAREQLAMHA